MLTDPYPRRRMFPAHLSCKYLTKSSHLNSFIIWLKSSVFFLRLKILNLRSQIAFLISTLIFRSSWEWHLISVWKWFNFLKSRVTNQKQLLPYGYERYRISSNKHCAWFSLILINLVSKSRLTTVYTKYQFECHYFSLHVQKYRWKYD